MGRIPRRQDKTQIEFFEDGDDGRRIVETEFQRKERMKMQTLSKRTVR